jgi:hypothetical protein
MRLLLAHGAAVDAVATARQRITPRLRQTCESFAPRPDVGAREAAQVLIDAAGAGAVFALSDALQCNYKTKLCWPSRPPAVLVSGTGQLPLT